MTPDLSSREGWVRARSETSGAQEEVGHCMLPYIRDRILELVNESLLVVVNTNVN